MEEIVQKARMQQKRDITANWQMAQNFVPYPGEIVVYNDKEKDKYLDPATPARIKVGDGVTPVGELPGISGELYVQTVEPINAGEGAVWIVPEEESLDPGISAVSDWHAQLGEVGYVKNKPIEVIQHYVTLVNQEEVMEQNSKLDVSENFYSGKSIDIDMTHMELILANLDDYVLIPYYLNGYGELRHALDMLAGQSEIQHAIAFCGSAFMGMSLTSLAILHLFGESASEWQYEVLCISNDTETSFRDESLEVGTHFYKGDKQGIYISSFKFFYNSPIIGPRYVDYFKDKDSVNTYSIGTVEDWMEIVEGGLSEGGSLQEEGVEVAKQALFAELSKYKRGDILLVPTFILSMLGQAGGVSI